MIYKNTPNYNMYSAFVLNKEIKKNSTQLDSLQAIIGQNACGVSKPD